MKNRLFLALSGATIAAFALCGGPAMAQSEAETACAKALENGTEDGMNEFTKAYPGVACDATSNTKGASGATGGDATGGDAASSTGGTGGDGTGGDTGSGDGGGDSGSNAGGSGG